MRVGSKRRAEEEMAKLNESYWLKRRSTRDAARLREAILQALRCLEHVPTSGHSAADCDADVWVAVQVLRASLMTDDQYHDALQDAASL